MTIPHDSDGIIHPKLYIKEITEGNWGIFTVLVRDGVDTEVQVYPPEA